MTQDVRIDSIRCAVLNNIIHFTVSIHAQNRNTSGRNSGSIIAKSTNPGLIFFIGLNGNLVPDVRLRVQVSVNEDEVSEVILNPYGPDTSLNLGWRREDPHNRGNH